MTAIGIGFNVPGVHKLRLTGPILAKIYFGQITTGIARRLTRSTSTPIYRT